MRQFCARAVISCMRVCIAALLLAGMLPQQALASGAEPQGLRLAAAASTDEIADDTPLDFSRPLGLTLVAPRGGVASDIVVARDQTLIQRLQASVGDFKMRGGAAVLPAARFQVRYAAKEGPKNRYRPDAGNRGEGGRTFYDDLLPTAPAGSLTVPIWLTASVPADAAPGEYTGTLRVTPASGKPVDSPVTLTVAAWKTPAPKDFAAHVGIIQSPESVALKYKVPLWSDQHFALIGTVFERLAEVGGQVLTVSAIANTQLGNYESMIRLVKNGERTEVDFSIMDRYLDTFARHCSPPKVFYIYVWDNRFDLSREGEWRPVSVTVLDKSSGEGSLKSFTIVSPEGQAYFKAVMDGVRQRVERRGWKQDCIMLGVASDGRPSEAVTEMFQKLAPYARWVVNSHNPGKHINGVEVGYIAYVRAGAKREGLGWRNPQLETRFQRDKHDREMSPERWRGVIEQALVCGYRGQGRIGADFWHVLLPGGTEEQEMDNRQGSSGWTPNLKLNCSSCALLAPGPNGAVSTARFEAVRESLQDCEARIAIEKVLSDGAGRERLGKDLTTRCEGLLARRAKVVDQRGGPQAGQPWSQMSLELFNLASEVESKR